jgi:hypothetical protein
MRRLLVAVLLCAGPAVTSAQDADLEYRVKAAYLFNFTKFIEWPDAAFDGGRSFAFSICVAGRNPFGPALSATLVGETAAGLPLAARVVNAGGAAGCHVLFVPAGVPAGPYLRGVGKAPVLTVGESPGFLAQGGAINFVIDGGRVRFEINQAAAERAQLRISSRLLQLGRGNNPQGGE